MRYRAWLPLPIVGLGLGASTARAADARDAGQGAGGQLPPEPPGETVAALMPPMHGGRVAVAVGAFTLLAILVAMAVLVGARSGSDETPPPGVTQIAGVPPAGTAAVVKITTTRNGTTTTTTTTTTGTTTDGSAPAAPSSRRFRGAEPRPVGPP